MRNYNNMHTIKLNIKDNPEVFDCVGDYEVAVLKDDYRRGSSFYKQCVVELTAKDGFPPEHCGFWKTNTFIYDTEYGTDEGITELTLVDKVEYEETIKVVKWQEVKVQ